jgi:hypothetical protein
MKAIHLAAYDNSRHRRTARRTESKACSKVLAIHVLILLFDKVITTIVRPTDRQQVLGSVLVETKKAS